MRPTPNRVSDTEAQRILEMIEEGSLKIGDRLPGQRELAAKLGIGRSSVREAVRYLEAVGILETRPGLGTYVISGKPYSLVATSLSTWLAENREEVFKVFQVREAVETKAAELAAANATETHIIEMQAVLSKMDRAVELDDFDTLTEMDYQFHDLISKAADNELLYRIIENIQGALMESRRAVLSLPGRARRSVAEHRAILEAIRRSDGAAAKEAMRTHLANAVSEIE